MGQVSGPNPAAQSTGAGGYVQEKTPELICKSIFRDINGLHQEADKEVKKMQSKINRQKIEQQALQRELALRYGTQDDILQKIENMKTLKDQNATL